MNSTISCSNIAARLEQAARTIAPVLVAVYCAGYCTGAWLHRLNDRLSTAWRRLLVPEPQVLAEQPAKPIHPTPAVPAVNALAVIGSELEALTCRQLRELTGCRSKLPKARLVALALSC